MKKSLKEIAGMFPLILWAILYLGARVALESDELADWLRVTIALLPVPFFAYSLILFIAQIRSLDELHIRVHLEALAVAFPLTVLLIMTLGLMELAVGLSPDDWSYRHIWPFLFVFYFLGLIIAWRRYQ